MFGFICKLVRHHHWRAWEVYSGEWFLVCTRCGKVRPLNEDGKHDHGTAHRATQVAYRSDA